VVIADEAWFALSRNINN